MSIYFLLTVVSIDFAIFLATWHILDTIKSVEQQLEDKIEIVTAHIGQLEDEINYLKAYYSQAQENADGQSLDQTSSS